MLKDKSLVTKEKLAEFQDLVDNTYVRRYDLQRMLTGFVDKPYFWSVLNDSYATRGFVAKTLLDYLQPKDLEGYATQEWVRETYGPLVDPSPYAKAADVSARFEGLIDEMSLATQDWVRGALEGLRREWDGYATKEYADQAAEAAARHHNEGLATEDWVLSKLGALTGGWATKEWTLGLFDSQLGSGGFASKDWVTGQIAASMGRASDEEIRQIFQEG